ncbi:MAG TPA: hypothetical protein VGP83_17175 [Pyrinomonadaceae bacterium]|jgi:hypothetical protein|nr:hypothetical protein [Pyrinomonadaceae bacterium]
MKRGDFVRIRRAGDEEWTRAVVAIVSENGKSVGLTPEGFVRAGDGLMGGFIPLLIEQGTVTNAVTGEVYELERE